MEAGHVCAPCGEPTGQPRAASLTSLSMSTPPLPSFSATRMVGLGASAATATTASGGRRHRQAGPSGGSPSPDCGQQTPALACSTGVHLPPSPHSALPSLAKNSPAHLPCWTAVQPRFAGMRGGGRRARPPSANMRVTNGEGEGQAGFPARGGGVAPPLGSSLMMAASPASPSGPQQPGAASWRPPCCAADSPRAVAPAPVQAACGRCWV